VLGTPYHFQYSLTPELLTEELFNNLKPLVTSLMTTSQAISKSGV
jgi:hypothetical protein